MWELQLSCLAIVWKISTICAICILIVWNYVQNLHILPLDIKDEYEYIIVGTGVGGATVASRIASEDVLILEAGTDMFSLFYVPVFCPMLQNSPFVWNYYTTPQENAAKALKHNQLHCPQGKIFGGSHMLNNMVYLRGHPEDYRDYVDGDYDYENDIEVFFERLEEDLQPKPLKFHTKLADALMEAGQESTQWNFTLPQVTARHGLRFTMAEYIRKFKKHRVLLGALVTRIIFQGSQATGVQFTKSNVEHTVRASKGIIIAAGAIGSPKILMQSGIGPTEHLQDIGIPTKINLPVGENLMDHVTTGYNLLLLNESLPINLHDLLSPQSFYNLFAHESGPLTISGCEATAILNVPPAELPNLQFMELPTGITHDYGAHLRHITNVNDSIWEGYFKKFLGLPTATILPIVLKPKSRGFVRLRNADPHTAPIINPNYLSHPHDTELLIQGIRIIQQILDTKAMKRIGAEINPLLFPGCEHHLWNSNHYWKCYVQHLTLTAFHPAGTCAMGKVVDYNFRVYHTKNLFIVDASVMPTLPSANPMATIGMLAHRFLAINDMLDIKP